MAKNDESAKSANDAEAALDQQHVPKERIDPGKSKPNPHREHQDRHGSGEGETGMQPGAGHPRGR